MIDFIKNIFWLLIAFFVALMRGGFKSRPENVRTVVIFQPAKLGDMVCTTPMFRAVKERYPKAQVIVIGNKVNEELLEHNRDINIYIVFEGILKTASKLRAYKIDFACSTGPGFGELVTLILSRPRAIAVPKIENGISPYEKNVSRLLRIFAHVVPHRMHYYAPREYLRLLEIIDIKSVDTTKHLAHSSSAEKHMTKKIGSLRRPLVIICPSAGNKVKEWSPDRFAELADRLVEQNNVTVLIEGSAQDTEKVNQVMNAITHKESVQKMVGFSLDELKALIASVDLFIAVDTGPLYIAEAYGIPTVDIVGPVDEREQPPQGEKHVVVTPPEPRVPQLFVMDTHSGDSQEIIRQLDSITVDSVYSAASLLLKEHE